MATAAQIAANRANAQKSTGPRTAEGKAASSANALKSGIYAQSLIIRGEDPAELEALRDDFYAAHQPESAGERALVDTLVHSEWILRRLRKCEAQLWEAALPSMDSPKDRRQTPLSSAFIDAEFMFTPLQRSISAAERAFHRALAGLERLRKSRALPKPADVEASSAKLASFPQSAPDPAPVLPAEPAFPPSGTAPGLELASFPQITVPHPSENPIDNLTV
jgi:hypothetical protein